jgi:transcriptional regulator of arginine metabolism
VISKRRRQQLITHVVRQGEVATQADLVEMLAALGCDVTQATVSRDVRELRLERRRGPSGRLRYTLPSPDADFDREAACAHMFEEFAIGVAAAQNLVVVRSEAGTAPGVGRVIDDLEHELIMGCVAGDDTVLVVTADRAAADAVASYLRALGG